MSLIYKTLFEVKLTHEYYVTETDGSTIFSLSDRVLRTNFLSRQYSNERDAVNSDVIFQFPKSLEAKYKRHNLKLLPSYSGFKIMVRVSQQTLPDTSVLYRPLAALPDDLDINVEIVKKDNLFESYTNSRLRVNLPAGYFFSNNRIVNLKVVNPNFPFLFLCNNVQAFDNKKAYEQGELAAFGETGIKQNYKTAGGTGESWSKVPGISYANENDRLLLPLKFYYSFPDADNITQATFTLTANFALNQNDDHVVKTITIYADATVKKMLLDFSDKEALLINNESFRFPDMVFALNVTATNGYSRNHAVIFSDTLYDQNTNWGIINIKVKPVDNTFRLIDEGGLLFKRRDALGKWQDPPSFEIPVKSRFTYWRYINAKGKDLKVSSGFIGCLVKENKVLLSNNPRSIARNYFSLPKTGDEPIYVPNPTYLELKTDEHERLFFDVVMPTCEAFPVG